MVSILATMRSVIYQETISEDGLKEMDLSFLGVGLYILDIDRTIADYRSKLEIID